MFAPLKLAQASLEQIKDFKENLPVIHILCNPGLRPRHWQKVSEDHHHIPPQCSLSHSLTRCQKSLGSHIAPDSGSSLRKMLKSQGFEETRALKLILTLEGETFLNRQIMFG